MSESATIPPEQTVEEAPRVPTRRLLAFEVGGSAFACDMESFREIVPTQRTTRLPGAPDTVCGLINLRGQIVTAIDQQQLAASVPRVRVFLWSAHHQTPQLETVELIAQDVSRTPAVWCETQGRFGHAEDPRVISDDFQKADTEFA